MNFDDGSVDTLKTEAASEGIWGNKLSVAIAADSILTTAPSSDIAISAVSAVLVSVEGLEVGSDIEFDNTTNQEYRRIDAINAATKTVTWTTGLTNAYPAATSTVISMEFKATLYTNGVLTEEHPGLGMNPDTTFFVEKALISAYIVGTDIKGTKANDYTDLPAVAAATALTTGADGLADVTESDYSGTQITKTGVFALDEVEGLFRFCCPNPLLTDADIPAAFITLTQNLVDYAESRVTVLLYSDVPYGTAVTAAVTFGDTFVSRNLALFYPWLKVVENSLDTWLPPSSF
ncbi:MAG: hypothetical protein ACXABY_37580, partial [Candidatus Thorarchaeota archaeon]